jgi:pimeloyl-ACP methyl ester carboxylesterase
MRHLLKTNALLFALTAQFISPATRASEGSSDSNPSATAQCNVSSDGNSPTTSTSNETSASANINQPAVDQASEVNWKNVPTQTIAADEIEFAYRELGKQNGGTPVVLLGHLAAVLDNWDPRVLDGIAAKRHVIAFDNRGIGASTGTPSKSIEQMADDATTFIKAMGFKQVDIFGFSMGGMIAQEIALKEPQIVGKLILAGTGPAGGEGISDVSRISNFELFHGLITFQDPKQYLFFTRTPNGISAGKAFLTRLKERSENRDKEITFSAYFAQLKALKAWGKKEPADLSVIKIPVLVANGDNDRMVPTKNTYDLARRLPNSTLIIYPDAGHGGVFQCYADFVPKALDFLAK